MVQRMTYYSVTLHNIPYHWIDDYTEYRTYKQFIRPTIPTVFLVYFYNNFYEEPIKKSWLNLTNLSISSYLNHWGVDKCTICSACSSLQATLQSELILLRYQQTKSNVFFTTPPFSIQFSHCSLLHIRPLTNLILFLTALLSECKGNTGIPCWWRTTFCFDCLILSCWITFHVDTCSVPYVCMHRHLPVSVALVRSCSFIELLLLVLFSLLPWAWVATLAPKVELSNLELSSLACLGAFMPVNQTRREGLVRPSGVPFFDPTAKTTGWSTGFPLGGRHMYVSTRSLLKKMQVLSLMATSKPFFKITQNFT